jgi:hypothetical protein
VLRIRDVLSRIIDSGSGSENFSKKDSEESLRKFHQKMEPDEGSEIRYPEKIHPGSGG